LLFQPLANPLFNLSVLIDEYKQLENFRIKKVSISADKKEELPWKADQ